ncbi:hypothetical protein Pst134EA_014958 [Puccinia striiformis f. sp. tritici]|uniref:hypothetical protein n=2 Tax=Puccinia striiformis f. sp. tritici TaxID=168172 RepID=UPI002007FC06|nr:hypothetical protein Pst134EA_014958 [Puccinia striiformis f. sp. tritici]KAH9462868.1 hypothetical protein Pst134EA_014958 [Puccinia striiformis f. sp. tritici]
MKKEFSRFSENSILSTIPTGVNPFDFLTDLINSKFFTPFYGFRKALLLLSFIFHLLIALFCLAILVLSFSRGKKRSQWLFRRLQIGDKSGQEAPLFWLNAGILMTITQFMGSVATQAYILIELKTARSVSYALRTPMEPALGLMAMCELLNYWFLMHFFVVAICFDQETDGDTKIKDAKRWTPSTTMINIISLGCPISIIIASVTLFNWLSSVHHPFMVVVVQSLDVLRQGSSAWNQLNSVTTTKTDERLLMTQLIQVTSQARSLNDQLEIFLERYTYSFHHFFCVLLVLHCITFLVFMILFCLLVKKLRQKASHSARASGSNSSPYYRFSTLNNALNIHEEQSTSRTGGLIDVAKRNRQLFHLLLRALCVMITMITSGILVILGITTTGDILRDPHWRAMMVWLSTVATAWSAIPIAWQCWRLCEEDLGSTSPVADKAKCASLAVAEEAVCMSIILTKPSQVAEGSIEIRLNPDDTIPTRSSPTKLTSFVESPEKLRPSHSTSYAEDTIDIRLNPDDIVHTPSSPTLAGSFVESLEKSRPSHSTA